MCTGAFTLACAPSTEAILRFFNFETRGNYTVPLYSQPGEPVADDSPAGPGNRRLDVTSLAYHHGEHILAVGLSSGRVQLLRHVHEDRCVVSDSLLPHPRELALPLSSVVRAGPGRTVCRARAVCRARRYGTIHSFRGHFV